MDYNNKKVVTPKKGITTFLFLIEHPHIGGIGGSDGRVRWKLGSAEAERSLGLRGFGDFGDADILERFFAHEQMQFHLMEELFVHEGVHSFEYFRHCVGKFLQGAGIVAADEQYAVPVAQRARYGGDIRPHDDLPVPPEMAQKRLLWLHAARGKPAGEVGPDMRSMVAAAIEIVPCETLMVFLVVHAGQSTRLWPA